MKFHSVDEYQGMKRGRQKLIVCPLSVDYTESEICVMRQSSACRQWLAITALTVPNSFIHSFIPIFNSRLMARNALKLEFVCRQSPATKRTLCYNWATIQQLLCGHLFSDAIHIDRDKQLPFVRSFQRRSVVMPHSLTNRLNAKPVNGCRYCK